MTCSPVASSSHSTTGTSRHGSTTDIRNIPLKLSKDSRDDSRRIVTQFDMHGVEKLGLLKMDFLGLRNLSVIEDTVTLLRDKGIDLDRTWERARPLLDAGVSDFRAHLPIPEGEAAATGYLGDVVSRFRAATG